MKSKISEKKKSLDFLQPFENEGKEGLKETSSNEIMAAQEDLLHHEPEEGDFEFCLLLALHPFPGVKITHERSTGAGTLCDWAGSGQGQKKGRQFEGQK